MLRKKPHPEKAAYLPSILKGMFISLGQWLSKEYTIQYPFQKPPISTRFRGEHKLTRDEQGRIRCVACYMCATACPALCIHIEAKSTPVEWTDRDKMPAVFNIDMLRCIYCGMCVEACPKAAIEMTNKIPRVYDNRKDFVYDINKLLSN